MNIVVVKVGSLKSFPPGLSLVSALLDLGHNVTLLAEDLDLLPERIKGNQRFKGVSTSLKGNKKIKGASNLVAPNKIRSFLKENRDSIDLVWTTTDLSARATGKCLYDFKYVIQLSELVETVPLIGGDLELPITDSFVKEATRKASCVVVPEYNRAHIQATYWDLNKVPMVLPNKPYPDPPLPENKSAEDILERNGITGRNILLYQGVFTSDRDLTPYAKALDKLDSSWHLVLMGRGLTAADTKKIEQLCEGYSRVHNIGFVAAPNHLAFTQCGKIGILPYKPGKTNRYSPLNALYCAPNKIWEYSRFGLPMIGSDVPGLALPFQQYGMGEVSDGSSESITAAIRKIESNYNTYSKNASDYYKSIDFAQIVSNILKEAVS